MGNPVGTPKIEMYFYFQPNVHFRPSPTTGGASGGGGKPDFLKKN
jgi:hypothetical protein